MELTNFIKDTIKHTGPITFAEFMQIALYDKNFGYYSTKVNKIGKQGDFVTAPEVSCLYGWSLANQVRQVFAEISMPVILEFGAGTGKLCIDILENLEKNNCLPECYYILEVSGELKNIQKQAIHNNIPHLANKVRWLSKLPNTALQGVVIVNEILDAMQVHRFKLTDSQVFESHITCKHNELQEAFLPTTNQELENYVQQYVTSNNYISEANLILASWLKEVSKIIVKGMVLIIDYGFPAHEYYHQDRNGGTIMCHYQQKSGVNPLVNIGKQDITAHVNFTYVAESAIHHGFAISGYTNQASFLINNDILGFLESFDSENLMFKNQEIKILLNPSEMGEIFKVMALTKELNLDLIGFQMFDKRARL